MNQLSLVVIRITGIRLGGRTKVKVVIFICICTIQVGNMSTYLTIVSSTLCIHHFATKFTQYFVLFVDLTKRIGASEGVIMCLNFDGVLKYSTLTVNHESADGTEVGNALGLLLTAGLASEVDLHLGGNKCVLIMTVVGIN
jgi:hypothetical protein